MSEAEKEKRNTERGKRSQFLGGSGYALSIAIVQVELLRKFCQTAVVNCRETVASNTKS